MKPRAKAEPDSEESSPLRTRVLTLTGSASLSKSRFYFIEFLECTQGTQVPAEKISSFQLKRTKTKRGPITAQEGLERKKKNMFKWMIELREKGQTFSLFAMRKWNNSTSFYLKCHFWTFGGTRVSQRTIWLYSDKHLLLNCFIFFLHFNRQGPSPLKWWKSNSTLPYIAN